MNRVGIIGIGNMGKAIAYGLIKNNREIIISNRSNEKLREFEEYKNVKIASSNSELVENSKYIILAVKPNMYETVIDEIRDTVNDKIIISIAAGFTIEKLNKLLPNKKIVMTMPNTPAMVFEAMSAICPNEILTEDEILEVIEIFNLFGRAARLDESQFSAFSAACGCLPAYVYMFIEAAADSAVLNGMKREDAYNFISQTVLGSAKMVLETQEHPAKLKDMVTSPGGTTIEGVRVLEKMGFRAAIIDAICAANEKSKNM
ncbi:MULTISPECIES: pyrroline-5-carboxylate reductase [Peptoniphilus]|uniref:pyrroline-5-carboxylate reductase n=1 Tax=Peptoniphilus TaxID=162289 RepID=UPI0001DAA0E3|nr:MULTISPECIES: pyrroline-5-carboxylate reductase [Peptoniphilus]EFI41674.1 pyrroline-5-carboxylate reductase [Peptoniphilus sp. oral taxon 386 str. F0131]